MNGAEKARHTSTANSFAQPNRGLLILSSTYVPAKHALQTSTPLSRSEEKHTYPCMLELPVDVYPTLLRPPCHYTHHVYPRLQPAT
jgi:hypothetical protein